MRSDTRSHRSAHEIDDAGFGAVVAAPFGAIGVQSDGDRITSIRFLERTTVRLAPKCALIEHAADQIERYLSDPRCVIDLPLAPIGTVFQRRVWQCIAEIPVGVTRRYGELAAELESVPRAVGQACGDNRFPLAIPCHRVVGAAGAGGFAHSSGGFLIEVKHWLLRHEALVPLDAR